MKSLYHFLLLILAFAIVSCSKEKTIDFPGGGGGDSDQPVLTLSTDSIGSGATPNVTTNLSFNCSEDWVIENPNNKMLDVSPTSGAAGNASVGVKWLSTNQDNEVRELSFTIKSRSGKLSKRVKVSQKPVFVFEKTNYLVDVKGGKIAIPFTCNIISGQTINLYVGDSFDTICEINTLDIKKDHYELVLTVKPNDTHSIREAVFLVQVDDDEDYRSAFIYLTQNPQDVGTSQDYSQDGKVTALQTHTKGQGVPIVIMGDAFIDTDIADGTYENTLREASEKLFTLEPMTSLRPYFDIYMVNAVSKNNLIAEGYSTVFETEFEGGASTFVFGNSETCEKYALKAINKNRLEDALVLVIINDPRDAGTCAMNFSTPKNDVCVGQSIAFVPLGPRYENTLHHEVVGHGLGKLDDEYGANSMFYAEHGSILDPKNAEQLKSLKDLQAKYALLNVSLESDITKTVWSEFAKDNRYSAEKIGMYEGGDTFPYGVWRSTENSLMLNGDELNAISRCLLYKRIMNIAHNYQWEYDYETFVKFDEPARLSTRSVSAPAPDMWTKKRSRPIIVLK